jgi:hypothetical protein
MDDSRWQARIMARALSRLKYTGLAQVLGQLQARLCKTLIEIFGQTTGPTCKIWVNPVHFSTGAPHGVRARGRAGEPGLGDAGGGQAPLRAMPGPAPLSMPCITIIIDLASALI